MWAMWPVFYFYTGNAAPMPLDFEELTSPSGLETTAFSNGHAVYLPPSSDMGYGQEPDLA